MGKHIYVDSINSKYNKQIHTKSMGVNYNEQTQHPNMATNIFQYVEPQITKTIEKAIRVLTPKVDSTSQLL